MTEDKVKGKFFDFNNATNLLIYLYEKYVDLDVKHLKMLNSINGRLKDTNSNDTKEKRII